MKHAILMISTAAVLGGCAMSPERLAAESDWDVCRATMGGLNSSAAEREAQRRALDCRPLYGVIQAKQLGDMQRWQALMNASKPAPSISCTSSRMGAFVTTNCN